MGSRDRLGPNGRPGVGEYYRIGWAGKFKIIMPVAGKRVKLPEFSHSSRVYVSVERNGDRIGRIKQIRIYGRDGFPLADIDVNHGHHHGMKDGEPHVHLFVKGEDGMPRRQAESRPLNKAEKRIFGKILSEINRGYL